MNCKLKWTAYKPFQADKKYLLIIICDSDNMLVVKKEVRGKNNEKNI